VEPPSQERGGEGIHEALLLRFSHLVILSTQPLPGTGREKRRRRRV
jgi:hypothetical protein